MRSLLLVRSLSTSFGFARPTKELITGLPVYAPAKPPASELSFALAYRIRLDCGCYTWWLSGVGRIVHQELGEIADV